MPCGPTPRRQADEAAQVLQDELRKLIEVAELESQMAEVCRGEVVSAAKQIGDGGQELKENAGEGGRNHEKVGV